MTEDKEEEFDKTIAELENDGDKYVRYEAASALAKIGDHRSLEMLTAVLTGPETEKGMKMEIMKYLEKSTDPLVKDALITMLKDSDMVIRGKAVEMLADLNAVDMADTFLSMLDNEEAYVRADAVKALGQFRYQRAADRLLRIVEERDDHEHYDERGVWRAAATALGILQEERAIVPLLKIVHDQEKYEGREALEALEAFGEKAVGPVIIELRLAKSDLMIENSLEVLGELQDVRGLGPVLDQLNADQDFVRAVFYAVESICKKNKCMPLKHVLEEFLRDSRVEESARDFIKRRCKKEGLNILLNDMEKRKDDAGKKVAEALKSSDDGLQILINYLNERDLYIRKEAVRRLGEIKSSEAADLLIVTLGDSDYVVREEAVIALGKLKEERAVPHLAGIMENARKSTQARIIEALGEIATDKAIWIILVSYSLIHMTENIDSALMKLGDRAVPHILDVLDDPRVKGFMYCYVYILGELKVMDAVPKLQELLNDDENSVIHEYIEKALMKIGVTPEKKEKKKGKSGEGKMTSFMSFDTFKKLND
jgi:HEAT repeat protein